MKEKELRLALVCYGGVSLAVYMHGITKEIQKLLYASKQLHSIRDPVRRHSAVASEALGGSAREIDSETGYFNLLRFLGEFVELRILVDIVAGASAGGINGIFLAQAIAQNRPLDPLRKLWLENADVERLLDDDSASGRFSKFYMRPLVWLFGKWQDRQLEDELGEEATLEMRRKLSRFVRSRWFRPPFSGFRFSQMLFDAMQTLRAQNDNEGSLLPPGYPLDLYVTVTDYAGHVQNLRLNSPREIMEREHRLVISFHDAGDDAEGRRDIGGCADLSFAARSTASFPGAFPSAMLSEMDRVAQAAGYHWESRKGFVDNAFRPLIQAGSDPETAAFIDGSVLNNKPFGPAIEALGRRPAHREVDRRIVYIEPNPGSADLPRSKKAPGFFSALRASLSDIPRNQPIRDDLEWVRKHSQQVERINHVVEGMADDVNAAIRDCLGQLDVSGLSPSLLTQWRITANNAAGRNAGFAYGAYVELKVSRMLDALALHLGRLAARSNSRAPGLDMRDRFEAWAKASGILPVGPVSSRLRSDSEIVALPWVKLLRRADAHYRVRRLRFVIRSLNRIYGRATGANHRTLDGVKQQLYSVLGDINRRLNVRYAPDSLCTIAASASDIQAPIDALCDHYDLLRLDDLTDARVSNALMTLPDLDLRRDLVLAFVGFAFFDIATFPMLQSMSLDEYDEIKVDRISPDDANALRKGGARDCLKGIKFGSFGAFFSRAYRENDYLWGRLHAADRLVDIILSSLDDTRRSEVPVLEIKRQLFASIVAAERPILTSIPEVFAQIEREITQMQ